MSSFLNIMNDSKRLTVSKSLLQASLNYKIMNITEEAKPVWNKLSIEQKNTVLRGNNCQNCGKMIDPDDFNLSIFEDQLAMFYKCEECGAKEVRLLDVDEEKQQAIDDDFEAWVQAKKAANPKKYR